MRFQNFGEKLLEGKTTGAKCEDRAFYRIARCDRRSPLFTKHFKRVSVNIFGAHAILEMTLHTIDDFSARSGRCAGAQKGRIQLMWVKWLLLAVGFGYEHLVHS